MSLSSPLPALTPIWLDAGQAALGTIGAGALVSLDLLTWSGTWWDGAILILALASWIWGLRAWSRMHGTSALFDTIKPPRPKVVLAALLPIGLAVAWMLLGAALGATHKMSAQELHGWAMVQLVILGLAAMGALLFLILGLFATPTPTAEENFLSIRRPVHHQRSSTANSEMGTTRSIFMLLFAAWMTAAAGAIGASACVPLVQDTPATVLGWWNARTDLDEQFRRTTMTPQDYWARLGTLARWRDVLSDRPFAQVLLPMAAVWPTRSEACAILTVRGRADELKVSAPGCGPSLAHRADPISTFAMLEDPLTPVLDDDPPDTLSLGSVPSSSALGGVR